MSDTAATSFAQPDTGDVHVPAPLGTPKPKGRFAKWLTFLSRFRDLVVGTGKFSSDEYDALVTRARGHAGGIAKADARMAASESAAHRERRFADAMAAKTGVMVGLWLDPLAAQALAIPGGILPDELHVTLAMIGDVTEYDDVSLAGMLTAIDRLSMGMAPLSGTVGGYGRFYGDDTEEDGDPDEGAGATDPDVFWASPDVVGLDDLAEAVEDTLAGYGWTGGGEHGFQPHVSLIYLAKDAPDPATKPQPIPLVFNAITLCVGDRRTTIPLRGSPFSVAETQPMAAYTDVVVADGEDGPRLFVDVSLADVPDVIPILPATGDYVHPTYGPFSVNASLIDEVIANFAARTRPQDVLLDLEHFDVQAGVPGRITKLVKRADGGLDGIPEFTDLGEQLIKRDRFKYCSADLRTYTNPLTGEKTPNVLVRVAMTNSPFFKEAHMPRMAASDDAANTDSARQFATEGDLPDSCFAYVPSEAKGAGGSKSLRKLRLCDMSGNLDAGIVGAAAAALGPGYRGQKVDLPAGAVAGAKAKVRAAWHKVNPDKQDDAMPAGIKATEETMADEDITQKFADLEAKLAAKDAEAKAFTDQLAAKDAEAKAFAEKLATLEDERRSDRLMAEIRGKSDANGTPYLGERAKVFAHMTTLAKQFGEESEEFRFYRDEKRAEAARARSKDGILAGDIGSDAHGDSTAEDRLKAGARSRQEANPKLTFAEAFDAECRAQPQAYAEYQTERKGR